MFNGTTTIQVRPLLVQACPASFTLGRDAPYIVKDFFFFFLGQSPVLPFCHVFAKARAQELALKSHDG